LASFDLVFWGKIWKALQRILGALMLFGFHQLAEYLLCLGLKQYPWLQNAVSEILIVAFLIIYFILLVEIIFIFLPTRKAKGEDKKS
jgi:hypothetical protein